ncbi:unnamed protein product [Trifolium pratense]|uniref:Uncharacterized protein n=1 Tax=Trifolium pratense TaxID=57577 RepID=A0ACB0K681_TRIPR|nr:unnamed protein product [Trifolium pratense]
MESNQDLDNGTSVKQILATALILSPTRELAHQITDHINALCNELPSAPRVVSVTGGLSIHKQQRLLSKADIIIATPGRLLEVVNSCKQTLESIRDIKFLVIDEADRLLSDGHFKEQKLAGRSKRNLEEKDDYMEYLMKKLKFREENPKYIDVNPVSQMAENLSEGIIECKGTEKALMLKLFTHKWPKRRGCDLLNVFSSPKSKGSILIATDVAARGLDIKDVQLVIHYHLPRAADIYVHRSGRTARQNSSGTSILICSPEEVIGMRAINSQGSCTMPKFWKRKKLRIVLWLNKKVVTMKSGLKNAAEELGVDYDSDAARVGGKGRGSGRRLRENEVRSLTKNELYAMKEELKSLLAHKVNVGISEKYLAGTGSVNVNELYQGREEIYLGTVDGIMMDS